MNNFRFEIMKPTDFKTALMKCWDDLIQKDKTNQARILKQGFEKVVKQKDTQKVSLFLKVNITKSLVDHWQFTRLLPKTQS